ncbi:MAG: tRNA (adenosine(37)-N6)-threonylcarbamoyltransferase complex dimerization subunit type 1 TsaB [Bacteroidales bacterium]|nr:tRNA (adenosine(37)-N6)-threonylcarbamoyltransferase complex dimerization subunit type 1 TsaB [Bacteroidales bacterium]
MSMILCLETSTAVCSVALVDNSNVIALRESLDGQNHAEKITIFIDEVMKEANISYNELEAIAVSKGPGSYTGLRIGVSTAKGLCYAMEKPLIAIDTLAAMTEGFLDNNFDNDHDTNIKSLPSSLSSSLSSSSSSIFCPMIDARRMEVYSAFFTGDMKKISETEALIIDESSFSDLKLNHHLYLFGDGADKLVSLFENEENITVIEKFHCSAAYMARLAEEAFKNNNFVDTAYFEPFYLKDFVPGIPKVKGL